MFEDLSGKFQDLYKKIRGEAQLSEDNVTDAVKEIRRALLDADVNYKVVKKFVDDVQGKAMGADVLRSVSPEQQFIKVVYDELVVLMGDNVQDIKYATVAPTIIMV